MVVELKVLAPIRSNPADGHDSELAPPTSRLHNSPS